jgi:hypothetical protein
MTCDPKKRYLTRHAAKQHLARLEGHGRVRHDGLRAYKCATCGFFHLGHLPANIRHGFVGRGEVYGDAA